MEHINTVQYIIVVLLLYSCIIIVLYFFSLVHEITRIKVCTLRMYFRFLLLVYVTFLGPRCLPSALPPTLFSVTPGGVRVRAC